MTTSRTTILFVATLLGILIGTSLFFSKNGIASDYTIKKFLDTDFAKFSNSIVKLKHGYMIVGYAFDVTGPSNWGWIMKTDDVGTKIWAKELGRKAKNSSFLNAAAANDEVVLVGGVNAILAGTFETAQGWIVKISDDGKVMWDKNLPLGRTTYVNDVKITKDGSILVVAGIRHTIWTSPKIKETSTAIMYDLNGNQLWKQELGQDKNVWASILVPLQKGGFIVAGDSKDPIKKTPNLWLARLDDKGKVLWEKKFKSEAARQPSTIYELPDGNIIVIGIENSKKEKKEWVSLIKNDSTMVSSKFLPTTDSCSISDIVIGQDDSFLSTISSCKNNNIIHGEISYDLNYKATKLTKIINIDINVLRIFHNKHFLGLGKDTSEPDNSLVILHGNLK